MTVMTELRSPSAGGGPPSGAPSSGASSGKAPGFGGGAGWSGTWPDADGGVPWSGADLGAWLVAGRRATDGCEAAWLAGLAAFDRDAGWAEDGQLSCSAWLIWRAGLARSTAFERLRVAHELSRRPVLAAALADGRASYAMVWAMVRATGTDREVDESFVRVAESGTVRDVEWAVRLYLLHADQERPLHERAPRRGLRIRDLGDGTARVEGIITDVEAPPPPPVGVGGDDRHRPGDPPLPRPPHPHPSGLLRHRER